MQKQTTVSVVIPSWNSLAQLKRNLPAVLIAAKSAGAEIIIVDDHTTIDNSSEYLSSLGEQIRFYQNSSNLGFARTVNLGVKHAKGDIVILLNTDVAPASDCFVKARQYFEDETLYALNLNSGEDWMGGEWERGLFHHFRVKPNSKNQNISSPSLWASGGQGAFSRQKWISLGGMDPLFEPFYWEDTDMGYRAWKRGWQILSAMDCHVVHHHDHSVISSSFTPEHVASVAQRNQFLFIWKNISDTGYLWSHLLYLPYYLLKYPGPVCKALMLLPSALSARSSERPYWKRSDRDILTSWTR